VALGAVSCRLASPKIPLYSQAVFIQVLAIIKAQLSPPGLAGAAFGFDSAAMVREMQVAADELVEGFIEMQAQSLSWEVTRRMQATDWMLSAAPREVADLIEIILGELRATQMLAAQVLSSDPPRSLLPRGPFPAMSTIAHILPHRSKLQGSAIQKDLQRMFARKISFSSSPFVDVGGGHKASIPGLLAHLVKLTLKTLVEEARSCTFSREGFQQMHLDCSMMRWALPAIVEDEGAVLSLLDEVLISCQERCLDCVPLEHSALERICDTKRKELLLKLA